MRMARGVLLATGLCMRCVSALVFMVCSVFAVDVFSSVMILG